MPDAKAEEKQYSEEEQKEREKSRKYYFGIAWKMQIAVILCCVFLAVFLVFMFAVSSEDITIENLSYFLRYIDTRQAEKSATTDTIVYDGIDSIVQYGVYKSALAVVSYDTVQVYDLTGEAILDNAQVNASPTLLCSDRYMLIYNIGSTTFQIYNSIECAYDGSYDYGIGVAAIGDSGTFLVSTRSLEYRSIVDVYDKNFDVIYRWYTPDKLVTAADFADGDEEFIICAMGTDTNGDCYTEVLLCPVDREEKRCDFRIEDEIIYEAKYTDDGGIVLLGGHGVYYYGKDALDSGAQQPDKTVSFSGYVPVSAHLTADMSYFILNKNVVGSNYELTVMDDTGTVLYCGNVQGEITKVLLHGDSVYVLLDRSLVRINMTNGNMISKEIETNAATVLGLDDERIMLCYADETQIITVEDFFTTDS